MVYSVSNNILEEKENWDTDYQDILKRFCFKKVDNWIEQEYRKSQKINAG